MHSCWTLLHRTSEIVRSTDNCIFWALARRNNHNENWPKILYLFWTPFIYSFPRFSTDRLNLYEPNNRTQSTIHCNSQRTKSFFSLFYISARTNTRLSICFIWNHRIRVGLMNEWQFFNSKKISCIYNWKKIISIGPNH